MNAKISEKEFIELFEKLGARKLAEHLGISVRNVYGRRQRINARSSMPVQSPGNRYVPDYPARVPLDVKNGVVIIGADCHIWPGDSTPAMRGFVKLCKELKPAAVILNGDVIDMATISKFGANGWENRPIVKEELEAAEDQLHAIVKASPKSRHFWMMGNHDFRVEKFLANNAAPFKGVEGFTLRDHFALWQFGISLWINNEVVVKHAMKGGVHATHNNPIAAGKSVVSAHHHSLRITPFTDYNGTRFGIDCGSMGPVIDGEQQGPQFSYAQDNVANQRSGFVVLTFVDGVLLWPEIVKVIDHHRISFRGQIVKV